MGKNNVGGYICQARGGPGRYDVGDLDSYDLIAFGNECFFDGRLGEILGHRTSAPKIFIDTLDDFFIRRMANG